MGGNDIAAAPLPPPPSHALARPKISKLAVASLILAVLWLLGIGSVLAIALGVTALVSVGRSAGSKRGRPLGVAGVLLGLFGLWVTAINLWPSTSDDVVYPVILRLGQTATESDASGPIRSAAVLAYNYPVTTTNPTSTLDADYTFALADVRECAGPRGLRKEPVRPFTGSGWEVNFSPGTGGGGAVNGPSTFSLRQPSFNEFMGLKPNQCASGWLTFEVDNMKPVYVTFDSPYAEWRVSS
jgi:hypothetical protein